MGVTKPATINFTQRIKLVNLILQKSTDDELRYRSLYVAVYWHDLKKNSIGPLDGRSKMVVVLRIIKTI